MGDFRDALALFRLLPVPIWKKPAALALLIRVARSEDDDPAYWSLTPKSHEHAIEMLSLPSGWTYDRQQLEAASHRQAERAWKRQGCGPEVWAIIRAKIMLMAKHGDQIPADLYDDMIDD